MCLSAMCGLFYNEDTRLKDLKCLCGYGYWDIFQDRFVEYGDRRFDGRGRALPMKVEEERIKAQRAKKNPSEFEACMRAQFILHCIDCGLRARLDRGTTDTGFGEPNELLRAMAELYEISNNDFGSRGLTGLPQLGRSSLPVRSRAEAPPEVVREPTQLTLARTSADRNQRHSTSPRSSEEIARPVEIDRTRRFAPSLDRRQGIASRDDIRPRQPAGERQALRHSRRADGDDVDREDNSDRAQNQEQETQRIPSRSRSSRDGEVYRGSTMFLPGDRISNEILEHHQKRETFGKWSSVARARNEGRDGFLISFAEDTDPLTPDDIKRIMKESAIVEEERQKKLGRQQRSR